MYGLALVSFLVRCKKRDRQTHRHTDTQTDRRNYSLIGFGLHCTVQPTFYLLLHRVLAAFTQGSIDCQNLLNLSNYHYSENLTQEMCTVCKLHKHKVMTMIILKCNLPDCAHCTLYKQIPTSQ